MLCPTTTALRNREGQFISSYWPQAELDFSNIDYWAGSGDHAQRHFLGAVQSYLVSFRRSHALTVFVGSTASASTCISTTFPFVSIK